jgi:hypothetical protein
MNGRAIAELVFTLGMYRLMQRVRDQYVGRNRSYHSCKPQHPRALVSTSMIKKQRLVCGEIAHLMQGNASQVYTVVKPYLHLTPQPNLK